jgi:hypothetical protein
VKNSSIVRRTLLVLALGVGCIGVFWAVMSMVKKEPPEYVDLGVETSPWLFGTWHQDLLDGLSRNAEFQAVEDPQYRKDVMNSALAARAGLYFGADSKGCEWISLGGESEWSNFTWKVIAVGTKFAQIEIKDQDGRRFVRRFRLENSGSLLEQSDRGIDARYRRQPVR